MKKNVRFLALFLVIGLLFGNCYTVRAANVESAVTNTAEEYLSLLAHEMYLYEDTDATTFTLASKDIGLKNSMAANKWEGGDIVEINKDLKTIEYIAAFTKYYLEASGITRE